MRKPLLNQCSYNGLCPSYVYNTSCQTISTCNGFGAGDGYEIDCFDVSRLETYCSTCWDVESFSVSFTTVEGKVRICFNKMIVRSDLNV